MARAVRGLDLPRAVRVLTSPKLAVGAAKRVLRIALL